MAYSKSVAIALFCLDGYTPIHACVQICITVGRTRLRIALTSHVMRNKGMLTIAILLQYAPCPMPNRLKMYLGAYLHRSFHTVIKKATVTDLSVYSPPAVKLIFLTA